MGEGSAGSYRPTATHPCPSIYLASVSLPRGAGLLFLALHSCRHCLGSEFREPQTSLSLSRHVLDTPTGVSPAVGQRDQDSLLFPLRRAECSQAPQYGAELWGPFPTSRLAWLLPTQNSLGYHLRVPSCGLFSLRSDAPSNGYRDFKRFLLSASPTSRGLFWTTQREPEYSKWGICLWADI